MNDRMAELQGGGDADGWPDDTEATDNPGACPLFSRCGARQPCGARRLLTPCRSSR